jgi:hypothetical protein
LAVAVVSGRFQATNDADMSYAEGFRMGFGNALLVFVPLFAIMAGIAFAWRHPRAWDERTETAYVERSR